MSSDRAPATVRVSVIVPVHNEGPGAADVCARVRAALAPLGAEAFETIVVDDGSTDGALAERPAAADRLIRHARNRGYGAAIKSGFHQSSGAAIVIIDADGTYDPAAIPQLLERLSDSAPMAVGARVGTASSANIPFARRPAKWVLNALANYLAGQRIPDLNSGLRAVRRDAFERYLHLLPDGFSLTTTLTLAVLCDGGEIAYTRIDYGARRNAPSKIRPLRDTQQVLITILRTVTHFNPLKVFLPLGGALAAASVAVLILSAAFADRIMDGTVAVLALTAAQAVFFGLLADAIAHAGKGRPRE